MEMLEKAIALAVTAHAGQKRKDGKTPYILHPLRVMFAVGRKLEGSPAHFSNEDGALVWTAASYYRDILMSAAVLHDVCEDCGMSPQEIAAQIHPGVGSLVDRLTRREGEPYSVYVVRAGERYESRLIKIADVEDNMDGVDDLDREQGTRLRKRYEWTLSVLK